MSEPLTFEKLNELGFDEAKQEYIGIVDYEDDEHLAESDWIIGDVIIGGKKYQIIHGFPGDTPIGMVFNDEVEFLVGAALGSNDVENDEIEDWYTTKTKEQTKYLEPFWYSKPDEKEFDQE